MAEPLGQTSTANGLEQTEGALGGPLETLSSVLYQIDQEIVSLSDESDQQFFYSTLVRLREELQQKSKQLTESEIEYESNQKALERLRANVSRFQARAEELERSSALQ